MSNDNASALASREAQQLAAAAGVTLPTVTRWLSGLPVRERCASALTTAAAQLGLSFRPRQAVFPAGTAFHAGANASELTHAARGPIA